MRPKERHSDAKQVIVWMDPEDLVILAKYQAHKLLGSRSAAIRAMIRSVGDWLERQGPPPGMKEPDDDEPPELRAAQHLAPLEGRDQGDSE